jgi:hypothetical protein
VRGEGRVVGSEVGGDAEHVFFELFTVMECCLVRPCACFLGPRGLSDEMRQRDQITQYLRDPGILETLASPAAAWNSKGGGMPAKRG